MTKQALNQAVAAAKQWVKHETALAGVDVGVVDVACQYYDAIKPFGVTRLLEDLKSGADGGSSLGGRRATPTARGATDRAPSRAHRWPHAQ